MDDMQIKSQDDFLRAMISHHQAALPMAEAVLRLDPDPKVAALARNIISAQTAQIEQMKSWLKPAAEKAFNASGPATLSTVQALLRLDRNHGGSSY